MWSVAISGENIILCVYVLSQICFAENHVKNVGESYVFRRTEIGAAEYIN